MTEQEVIAALQEIALRLQGRRPEKMMYLREIIHMVISATKGGELNGVLMALVEYVHRPRGVDQAGTDTEVSG